MTNKAKTKSGGTNAKSTNGPAKPPKKREREITDAAAEIFHRQGYADTSVQDIANAVGILKGSLYYYIESKEDLLFRVIEEVHEDARVIIDDVAALDASPLERLYEYLRRHLEYNTSKLTKIAVYYHDVGLLSPDRRKHIASQRAVFQRFVVGLVEEAQAAGDIDPGLDPKIAANCALGMLNWIYTWYRPGGPISSEELGAYVAELLVHGLDGASSQAVLDASTRGKPTS